MPGGNLIHLLAVGWRHTIVSQRSQADRPAKLVIASSVGEELTRLTSSHAGRQANLLDWCAT